jgi:hypothetical protein
MKNRNDITMGPLSTLDEKALYAIERKARAARAQEMARLIHAGWRRVAALFHFASAGGKAAGHA